MTRQDGRRSRFFGIAGLGIAVFAAGCQNAREAAELQPPAAPKVSQSDLLAFCPPVGLREGTAFFTSYAAPAAAKRGPKGPAPATDVDAALAPTDAPAAPIRYQTAITDVTRTCTRENGQLAMTIAVAGRIVPGPAGTPGAVALPIRIAVVNGPDVLFTKLYRFDATVASATTASTFLFTAPDVAFADPGVRSVRAFAGFDEGPPAKPGS